MALSKLSGDEQGIILGQLLNALEPCLAVYFSSASSELRVLLTPALRQQLKADHEAAAALCHKIRMGCMMGCCKGLREAKEVDCIENGLSAADLAMLGRLGTVLPALDSLSIWQFSGAAGPDGVQRLAEGLVAGALPAMTYLAFNGMHVGNEGASAFAAPLGRGALPRLKTLLLTCSGIGDAGLVALAPALRRLPALVCLSLGNNPLGDDGIAALVAPPPPVDALPPPTGGLKKLMELALNYTQITDAGCAALAATLNSGALPALKDLSLVAIPASNAAKAAVHEAHKGGP